MFFIYCIVFQDIEFFFSPSTLLQKSFLTAIQDKTIKENVLRLEALRPLMEDTNLVQDLIMSTKTFPDPNTNAMLLLLVAVKQYSEWYLVNPQQGMSQLITDIDYAIKNIINFSYVRDFFQQCQREDYVSDPDYLKDTKNKQMYLDALGTFRLPPNLPEQIKLELICHMIEQTIEFEKEDEVVPSSMNLTVDQQQKILYRSISNVAKSMNNEDLVTLLQQKYDVQEDVKSQITDMCNILIVMRNKDHKIQEAFEKLQEHKFQQHISFLILSVFKIYQSKKTPGVKVTSADFYRMLFYIFHTEINNYEIESFAFPDVTELQKQIILTLSLSYLTTKQDNINLNNVEMKSVLHRLIKRIPLKEKEYNIFSSLLGQPITLQNCGLKLKTHLQKLRHKEVSNEPRKDEESSSVHPSPASNDQLRNSSNNFQEVPMDQGNFTGNQMMIGSNPNNQGYFTTNPPVFQPPVLQPPVLQPPVNMNSYMKTKKGKIKFKPKNKSKKFKNDMLQNVPVSNFIPNQFGARGMPQQNPIMVQPQGFAHNSPIMMTGMIPTNPMIYQGTVPMQYNTQYRN